MNIIVLDACRDNPFAATASAKGLAPMDAPPGTLLAYATAPGNVAEDGDAKSGNGLYTRFLVKEIGNPAAKIEDVFKRVRLQVRRQSDGRQVPWESTSLEEDFFFGPHTRPDKTGDGEQLQQVADALLREKVDWDRIKTSSKADDLYAFLQKYPNGLISEQAQFRLDQLQRPKVAAQPGANGVKVLASGTNRYLVGDEWTVERTDHLANTVRLLKRRVTRADDEQVVVNNGGIILDQMGGTVRNGTGTKEPPLLNAPSDLAVGKRWRSAFINTHTDGMKTANFYDFRVQALEDITVPAGRFKAYRVERNGQAEHSNGRLKVMTGAIWIDPATMVVVQSESQHRVRGKLVEHQSDRLVELKRVPREGRS